MLKYPAVPRGAFGNRRANLFLDTRSVWLYETRKCKKKKKTVTFNNGRRSESNRQLWNSTLSLVIYYISRAINSSIICTLQTKCTWRFMVYFIHNILTPTCFGRCCGHLQGDVDITRMQKVIKHIIIIVVHFFYYILWIYFNARKIERFKAKHYCCRLKTVSLPCVLFIFILPSWNPKLMYYLSYIRSLRLTDASNAMRFLLHPFIIRSVHYKTIRL
jgi:hypothetical protein